MQARAHGSRNTERSFKQLRYAAGLYSPPPTFFDSTNLVRFELETSLTGRTFNRVQRWFVTDRF